MVRRWLRDHRRAAAAMAETEPGWDVYDGIYTEGSCEETKSVGSCATTASTGPVWGRVGHLVSVNSTSEEEEEDTYVICE